LENVTPSPDGNGILFCLVANDVFEEKNSGTKKIQWTAGSAPKKDKSELENQFIKKAVNDYRL
jgi:hypothetical protein